MVAGIPADTPVSPANVPCSVEKGGKVLCVCVGGGGTWYTTKRGPFLDFAEGLIQACCVMSLLNTVARSLFQRLVSFVKQKKKMMIIITKTENYRSRIGKVHGSEITFKAIMCLLAIIFYGFVLPKAQFTMVLLKVSSHLGT